MANTFTCLQYHVVFSTKHREPWIRSDVEERVWAYLGGIARENGLNPLRVGGVDDHIHMLLGMPPAIAVSEALKRIKGASSGWIKQNIAGCSAFAWQDGYGAFTLSKSQEADVRNYILKQRKHHRVRTFQEEYRAMLDCHGVRYDDRYLWD